MKQKSLDSFFLSKNSTISNKLQPSSSKINAILRSDSKSQIIELNSPPTENKIEMDVSEGTFDDQIADEHIILANETTKILSPNSTSTSDIDNLVVSAVQISDYEITRLENIKRNFDFLAQLGLTSLDSKPISLNLDSNISKKRKNQKSSVNISSQNQDMPIPPQRRSSRLSKIVINYNNNDDDVDTNDTAATTTSLENIPNEEDDMNHSNNNTFDDSEVIKYIMSLKDTNQNNPFHKFQYQQESDKDKTNNIEHQNDNSNNLKSLPYPKMTGYSLYSPIPLNNPSLAAIYNMQFHPLFPNLLLTSGKGGNVTLFQCPPPESLSSNNQDEDNKNDNNDNENLKHILLSFQAHNRWISGSKFINTNYNNASEVSSQIIVTASDDGYIKIWDINKINITKNSSQPLLLHSTNNIHNKGIFSLDISSQNTLLTGSKDRTICISTITSDFNIIRKIRQCELHTSVVKCVAWQYEGMTGNSNSNVFASCSTDNTVCIKDTRTQAVDMPELRIGKVHNGAVNCVVWGPHPENQHYLATSGFDAKLNVFDSRYLSGSSTSSRDRSGVQPTCAPLFVYQGHTASNLKKYTTILSPRFLTSDIITIPGEGSHMLSLYSLTSGRTISRGGLPDQPMVTISQNNDENVRNNELSPSVAVACKRHGQIYLLESDTLPES